MLTACFDPELLAEITLQPVRRHGVDAAILFSDIVVPLYAAGTDIDIVAGTGPVVAHPVRSRADVAALPRLEPEQLKPVADGVRLLVEQLGRTPLIGFAGAPFTLASYLIEGGPSKDHARTKALMHGEPELWHELAGALAQTALTFLRVQLDAGVDAVQLFDSWAGALSAKDYREFVLPHSTRCWRIASYGVPITSGWTVNCWRRETGADVVGVDWRVPLTGRASTHFRPPGAGGAKQPRPALLTAPWPVIGRVRASSPRGGPRTHLQPGHGVLPETDRKC